ncbi:MAG TPA: hypothetical protein VKB78_17005 [Pirellulales bacterium]|nr:hypothetical protein [Pirellulales bacterium]
MIHPIEFRRQVFADIDLPDDKFSQRVIIKEGTRLAADIKPYVTESTDGPVEVADLVFEDGSVARAVRYSAFQFVEGSKRRRQ